MQADDEWETVFDIALPNPRLILIIIGVVWLLYLWRRRIKARRAQ